MSKDLRDEGSGSVGLWSKSGSGRGNNPAAGARQVCEGSTEASVAEVESEGRAVGGEVWQVLETMFIS